MTLRSANPFIALAIALLCLSASRSLAQIPAKALPNEIGAVYLGNGRALAAMKPRLLTENARVSQFVCSPIGNRVAFVTSVPDGKNIDEAVGIVSAGDGSDTVYYRRRDLAFDPRIFLYGWSDDAAYFAFSTADYIGTPTPNYAPPFVDTLHVVDMVHHAMFSAALPFDRMVPPATADDPTPQVHASYIGLSAWGPGQRLLALTLRTRAEGTGPSLSGLCLFNPEKRTSLLLFTETNQMWLDGWLDATRIAYHDFNDDTEVTTHSVYDLATGKSTPIAGVGRLARAATDPASTPEGATTAPAPGNETLTLSNYSQTALATASPTGEGGDQKPNPIVDNIWIKRTGGRVKPSLLCLDSFARRMDVPYSHAQFLQNGGFDRNGVYHVVYESEGDLKVVDLVPRGATPEEKVAGGEPMNCDEEIVVAQDQAKEIGLGILQYAQDYNDTLPAGGDGFHDEIKFYVKDDGVFILPSGVRFQYTPPASLKLADMDSPASDPLGEFDLPCKRVVAEGDGHVKVLPYPTSGQSGGQ
jgi:hypothetical protein